AIQDDCGSALQVHVGRCDIRDLCPRPAARCESDEEGAKPCPRRILLQGAGVSESIRAWQALRLGRACRCQGARRDLCGRQQALPGACARSRYQAGAGDADEASLNFPWLLRILNSQNFGGRFSAKALMPSLISALRMLSRWRRSAASSSNLPRANSLIARFMPRIASGALPARMLASLSTS